MLLKYYIIYYLEINNNKFVGTVLMFPIKISGSSNGSDHSRVCAAPPTATLPTKSGGSSASESGVELPHNKPSNNPRSRSGGSRSSGSSVATATTSPPPQPGVHPDNDLSASRQSFRMAMGNPCEFFVDVM